VIKAYVFSPHRKENKKGQVEIQGKAIKREIQNDCWTTDLESNYFKLEQLAPNKQEIINPKYFDSVLFKITGETVCHEAKWYLN